MALRSVVQSMTGMDVLYVWRIPPSSWFARDDGEFRSALKTILSRALRE
jgi:hypothetical protein